MDFGYWWSDGCGMVGIFSVLCAIFMVAIIVAMLHRCGCMFMGRGRSGPPDDGHGMHTGYTPFSEERDL